MPRTSVRRSTISSSGMDTRRSSGGTTPSSVFAARSLIAAVLLRDRPAPRSRSSAAARMSDGRGKGSGANSATTRERIVAAALPLSCWYTIDVASASNGLCIDEWRMRNGPASLTARLSAGSLRESSRTTRAESIARPPPERKSDGSSGVWGTAASLPARTERRAARAITASALRSRGSSASPPARARSTPSRASSLSFWPAPPGAENPPGLPLAPSTRWQGTASRSGFFASAWPTARAAFGAPNTRASSP